MRGLVLAALIACSAAATAAAPERPLIVYAAGSTTGALGAILEQYERDTGRHVDLKTGPAGLMRERIEAGDPVDLFVSANMTHPEALQARGMASATARFAVNRLCVYAQREVGLTTGNLLERLLDPAVRIGTSTPKADPGGDYALELFEKADAVRPGATAVLKAKARQVVGGQIETAPAKPMSTRETMAERGIDVSVGYCSARKTTPDDSVSKVELPPELSIHADYGMAIVMTSGDHSREAAAGQLAMYLLSRRAQALLVPYGFTPVLEASAEAR